MSASDGEYWETRLSENFSLAGVGFAGLGLCFNEVLYRQRAVVVGRALRRYHIEPREARILELGPGTGFFVSIWKERGAARVVGLDITSVAVEHLRRAYPEFEFAVADIGDELPESLVPRGAFDLVTAFDVLFHILDDRRFDQAIETAAGALRSGGHLLATDLFLHDAPLDGPHQRSRRLRDYEIALGAHGFRILGRLPVFAIMHPGYDLPPGMARSMAFRWWNLLRRTVQADRLGARVLAPTLGLADRILTAFLREGPTTELLVARKR